MALIMHREIPSKSGYYWFQGAIYHEGALGGTISLRTLARVDSDAKRVLIEGTWYGKYDLQGEFYGIVPSPPWESTVAIPISG